MKLSRSWYMVATCVLIASALMASDPVYAFTTGLFWFLVALRLAKWWLPKVEDTVPKGELRECLTSQGEVVWVRAKPD